MIRAPERYAAVVLLVATLGADCGKQAECGSCFSTGYRIDLSAIPGGTDPPPAVLFSGYRDGWCQDDLVCTGSPDVHLGDLQHQTLGWPLACDAEDRELMVFAGGQAPVIGQIATGTTELALPRGSPKTLSIAVWATPGAVAMAKILGDAEDAVVSAEGILADHGTGITLNAVFREFPAARLAQLTSLKDDAWCDIYDKLNGVDDGGFTNPLDAGRDPNRLNVYWVRDIRYAQDGRACWVPLPGDPTSRPYIIFVDGDLTLGPATMAHELGHALGQMLVTLSGGTSTPGHVNELKLDPYLSDYNLMYSGVMDVRQVTIGQIYRMHFDRWSWLWRGVTPGAEYPRTCQTNPVEGGPCPPLTLNAQGWP